MPKITPTVGRKVWVFLSDDSAEEGCTECLDDKQPFDGTIIFVHPDGSINCLVADHEGQTGAVERLKERLYVEGETAHGDDEDFYCWMPYQMGQAKKAFEEAKSEEEGK